MPHARAWPEARSNCLLWPTPQASGTSEAPSTETINAPTGMLIANDVDTKRAYLLVHQVKRLRSPLMIATTHSAQFFPNIGGPRGSVFDRILCDVPCTGDGTLRKEPRIWERWCARVPICAALCCSSSTPCCF